MDIYIYKIIDKNDYDRGTQNGMCNGFYELEYEPGLGKIKKYPVVKEYIDYKKMFENIGLCEHNYFMSSGTSHGMALTRYNNPKDTVVISKTDFVMHNHVEYVFYAKRVYYIRVGLDKNTFPELLNIMNMINGNMVTKDRFKELLYHFPVLYDIWYSYYDMPKDLDFDVLEISY